MLIDSFLFFQELELLKIRLEYLYPFVDKFLIMAYAPGIKVQDAFYNLESIKDTERHVTVDGGVKLSTVNQFRNDPLITLVAGSKVLFNENYKENLQCLIS